jgi:hypothetical protein
MRTISIESTPEAAHALSAALAAFGPHVSEKEPGGPVVRVEVTGGSSQIVAILNAIQEHVNARADGPTLIDLDGRSYVMDAPARLRPEIPGG